ATARRSSRRAEPSRTLRSHAVFALRLDTNRAPPERRTPRWFRPPLATRDRCPGKACPFAALLPREPRQIPIRAAAARIHRKRPPRESGCARPAAALPAVERRRPPPPAGQTQAAPSAGCPCRNRRPRSRAPPQFRHDAQLDTLRPLIYVV